MSAFIALHDQRKQAPQLGTPRTEDEPVDGVPARLEPRDAYLSSCLGLIVPRDHQFPSMLLMSTGMA